MLIKNLLPSSEGIKFNLPDTLKSLTDKLLLFFNPDLDTVSVSVFDFFIKIFFGM